MPRLVTACALMTALALAPDTALAQAVHALEVPGFRAAAFVTPDAPGQRPVVIGLHGNFDRPEWMCAAWAGVVAGRAFLLCPRGEPRADAPELDRWQLPAAARLRREIQAARRALEARYPGRLAPGPDLYVGFSQGAHRISRMAVDDPAAYPRIQLVEGGASLWRDARRYARSEGRVAFVCAMRWCEMRGTRAARTLERGRAQARLERRDGAHHDLRVMEPAIRETFEWLIAGDARFGAAP
ncbi:MAG: hypothetical protein SangKO_077680 [Sandaracinaceae bacterium]